jgi:plastocyanin
MKTWLHQIRKQLPLLSVVFIASTALAFSLNMNWTNRLRVEAALPEGVHEVALADGQATPSVIIIKVGESVQFNAKDDRQHDIGQGRGNDEAHRDLGLQAHEHEKGIQSGPFGPDEGYRVLFSEAGIFDFHDHLNPTISITVIVQSDN